MYALTAIGSSLAVVTVTDRNVREDGRMGAHPYTKGLHEVADRAFAYLQPDGGWGWSNAGLVVDGDATLLVDTLFDLKLTAEMLATMRAAVPAAAAIGTVVNTHANGDHCWGNQLVRDAEIVGSRACAEEMGGLPPSLLAALAANPPDGPAGEMIGRMWAPFDFEGIEIVPPTTTFDGELTLRVGDRELHLIEVGPAHTEGDVIAHLPDAGVVYTGDILFNGGHPIVWAGPVANWIAACDRIVALDPPVVVPGHGSVCGTAEVATQADYFRFLLAEAGARAEAGMSVVDAARDIDLGPYAGWGEGERLVANVAAVYRDLGHEAPAAAAELLPMMALFAVS
jgi:cyclase